MKTNEDGQPLCPQCGEVIVGGACLCGIRGAESRSSPGPIGEIGERGMLGSYSFEAWPYDTSYPFLRIARRQGLAYGDVIRVAQDIEDGTMTSYPPDIPLGVLDQIADAVNSERKRREKIQGNV